MTLRIPAELLHGPFTLKQARALGVSGKVLSTRRFVRLFPRVYVAVSHQLTFADRCRAALLTAPTGAAICGVSALRLRGLDLPTRMQAVDEIEVLLAHRKRWRPPPGIRVRRTRRQWSRDGEMLASPAIVFAMLALDGWSAAELVQVGDRMTGRKKPWTTPGVLRVFASASRHQRGRMKLAHAAALVRARTDSIPETKLRLLLVERLAQLGCPQVGLPVRDATGWPEFYLDLAYPELAIALEYDGAHHWATDRARRDDYARQRALEARGWIVIRATAYDLIHPEGLLDAVVRAARARSAA